MTKMLMLGCGKMGEGFLSAASILAIDVHLVETKERVIKLREKGFEFHLAGLIPEVARTSEDSWIDICMSLLRKETYDGILPFTETQIAAAAFACEAFDLPGPGLLSATASRRKTLQRGLLSSSLNPQVSKINLLIEDSDEERLGSPWIQKPTDGTGSDGVRLVTKSQSLRSHGGTHLFESYVSLPEYSWEGIVHDGKILVGSLTRKLTTGAPEFVEIGHVANWGVADPLLLKRATQAASDIVDRFRIRSSMICIEFRADEYSLTVMEFMTRMPGDALWDIGSRALGVDLYQLALAVICRFPSPCIEDLVAPSSGTMNTGHGVVFLISPDQGTLVGLDGSSQDLEGFVMEKDIGAQVGQAGGSGDRVAYKFVTAANPAEVLDSIAAIHERVRVEVI